MAVDDLDELEGKLRKRGFKYDDAYLHECEKCKERACRTYRIVSRHGGRDISLCLACGDARSWQSGAGMDGRAEEAGFDLRKFLG
jgi:hypothetical protein